MAELHLTVEILRAFAQGDVSPHDLVAIGLEHMRTCPLCQEGFRLWKEELAASKIHLLLSPALTDHPSRDLKKRQAEAERDTCNLLRVPQTERLKKIERSLHRFRGPALAANLLRRSRDLVSSDLDEAYGLAEVAQAALLRSPNEPGVSELSALATAYLGDCLRARGELREAFSRLERARSLIRQERVADAFVLAEIDLCEGRLAADLRLFEKAEGLLTRSIFFFAAAGNGSRGAHARLLLAHLLQLRGDLAKAIEVTQEAAESVPAREEYLSLCAYHNLALLLCEAGRYSAAAEVLCKFQDLYERFPFPIMQLRHLWLQGTIYAGLGQIEAAEQALSSVRDGFLAMGFNYDAEQVSRKLDLLHAGQDQRE